MEKKQIDRQTEIERETYFIAPEEEIDLTADQEITSGFKTVLRNAYKKIEIEAPYHALTNAGHISYIELDGDPLQNLDAFESVIRVMKESGIGYGSINHPVDRDPCCGFTGIIGDTCPQCGRHESDDGVGFERIRRITGYLVGTLDNWNNGKRAEERDRVKHDTHVPSVMEKL